MLGVVLKVGGSSVVVVGARHGGSDGVATLSGLAVLHLHTSTFSMFDLLNDINIR